MARKDKMSEEAYKRKLDYNKKRNKELSSHHIAIKNNSLAGQHLSKQPNKHAYIVSLIEADMKKQI